MGRRSVDTETTGVDFNHGARPFLVTTCVQGEDPVFWEWDVDPETREPIIPQEERREVRDILKGEWLVTHNGRFDVKALSYVDPEIALKWNWVDMDDTLIRAHLLASNKPKDLTSLTSRWLGVNIEPYEIAVKEAVKKARAIARKHFPTWMIAKQGLPCMPSAGGGEVWKYDMWLPRAIWKHAPELAEEGWDTVTSRYANVDSETTINLEPVMAAKSQQRQLEKIYRFRMKLLPIIYKMETNGVTASASRIKALAEEYEEESRKRGAVCKNLAALYDYDLTLPDGSVNNSVRKFFFEILQIPELDKIQDTMFHYASGNGAKSLGSTRNDKKKKTDIPSMDKAHIEGYMSYLEDEKTCEVVGIENPSVARTFLTNFAGKKTYDTACSYLHSYSPDRFGIVWRDHPDWLTLYPSINPTGTDTLRCSSARPNEQNISKKELINLRFGFGPGPGREWWSCDAENIELRLPAYEVGEDEMIALFERPNDPPYFGSNHLLVAHILHPKMFEECYNPELGCIDGRIFKKKYASTWYQWVKNGNFAVQYGAVPQSGTADRAYHVPGGQLIVQARFRKLKALNDQMVRMAEHTGYVETIPDKTIDPDRGYPLLCRRDNWGRIAPTVPLNYHVQGSAMWWTTKAMVRVQELFDDWNRKAGREDYKIVMQVHDEMVFDFPKRSNPKTDRKSSNLSRIREVQRLMAMGGDDFGIPTPVSCEYHETSWGEGIRL